ncbi:glycosyltransferase family 1 protein [Bradyrhizobium sp.]|uniref:glycosyltransferase family 4 protein n=1 Tax=Bradyrhizobium sp. TaxID=376 RepID=UPI001D1C885E|nr:glycosyltransferase family 1 protein [Bradyrhizobium sp.]MBI5321101.1 glycosyltransferase family 4 protein [Bradyrhizobium sp.]
MAEQGPRRVAFTYISRRRWAGGYNYQLNLFAALARHCPGKIVPVLFAGTSEPAAELAPFSKISGVEVVQAGAFDRQYAGLAAALVTGIDRKAADAFETKSIDVVFENARFFGWRLPVPALAWFPDFQHRKLPGLFSPVARWRRELGFRAQIASHRSILLSSESALADFRAAYPGASNPVAVARFATEPSPDLLTADAAAVIAEHRLPEKFFYLPNQFYRHKNHLLVINALTILKQRGVDVVVAASGSTEEPRKSDYFSGLMREVADRGIQANFRYLGLIPLPHVYALLCSSMALINPSRFEGWSTTVEEAKSFGVPMILSDLAVHREQAGAGARYFEVDNAEALAGHLVAVAQSAEPPAVRNLLPGLDKRVAAFALDFVAAVEKCADLFGRRS